MKTVEIESQGYRLRGTWYFAKYGAPTLLLLHGLGFYSFEYDALAPLLSSQGFNCLTIDFRCHGFSEGKRGEWTIEDLIEDARAALDFLDKEHCGPIGVFGNSLGATVAVYAASRDNRIRSIAASNCATKPSIELFTPFRSALLHVMKKIASLISFRLSVNYFIPYSLVLTDAKLISKIQTDPKIAEARKISTATYSDMFHWDASKAVTNVHCPVLILYGNQDHLQSFQQSNLLFDAANEPKKLEIIPTGHVPNLENPELLSPILSQWFQSTLGRQA